MRMVLAAALGAVIGTFFSSVVLAQAIFTEDDLRNQGIAPLSQAELKATFEGKTFTSTKLGRNLTVKVYHDREGGKLIGIGKKRFERKYWYEDGKLCSESVRKDVGNFCVNYYKVSNALYRCLSYEGGACPWKISEIEDGNTID